MKKLLLFIILSAAFAKGMGQSKNQREQWIAGTIKQYAFHNKNSEIYHVYELTFSNGNMMVIDRIEPSYSTDTIIIPLKQITTVKVGLFQNNNIDEEGYQILFKCKKGRECIQNTLYPSHKIPAEVILLQLSFQDNELPKKMQKVLKRIIRLSGGRAHK
ncbi:hypothetical protein BH09BAC2_BH09BAC2_18850 [soil metagenome]